jgi:hypothetical protein
LDWDYDSKEIEALRDACGAFLDMPSGANASRDRWVAALVRLVVLAEQTRAFHDTPPRKTAQVVRFDLLGDDSPPAAA